MLLAALGQSATPTAKQAKQAHTQQAHRRGFGDGGGCVLEGDVVHRDGWVRLDENEHRVE